MRDLDPELMERAGELNIVIKGTWGNERIKKAIDAVEVMNVEAAKLEGDDFQHVEVSVPVDIPLEMQGVVDSAISDEKFLAAQRATTANMRAAVDVVTVNKLRESAGYGALPDMNALANEAYDELGSLTDGRDRDKDIKAAIETVDKFHTLEWANERAAAIWKGQSADLDISSRVGRIRAALKQRGFTRFEELILPTKEDYKQYL